jgi:hypothetical protein
MLENILDEIVTGSSGGTSKGKLNNTVMHEDSVIIPLMGMSIPIIITIGAFIMIAYIRKFVNLERMAIIEKGLSPELFKNEGTISFSLRASLLLIGVGFGFLIGYALDRAWDMEEVGYFSMLFICGGIGLGLAYIIEDKKQRERNNK